jgi:hypothetical protein
MFKKIFKFMFIVIMFALFIASITQAQTTKVIYPVFSISPMGGVQFPLGDMNNTYKTSWNAGLDLNLKINRETSFFLYGGYHDMPAKTESNSPDASVIQITAGPRYIFTSQAIKAQFFIEGGLGVYIFGTKEYTLEGVTIPSSSTVNFGINIGPGATIPLGKSVDLIMKVKLHDMFMDGGSQTFITAIAGIDFRL